MKPLLASIFLLLLALCRPSSVAGDPAADSKAAVDAIQKLIPAAQKTALEANGEHELLILDLIGATVFMTENSPDSKSAILKEIINNGVSCALEQAAVVTNIFYGATKTPAQKLAEDPFATKLGINPSCSPVPTDEIGKCYCTDNDPVIVCGAKKFKKEKMPAGYTHKTCPKAALDKLKQVGPDIATLYDFTKLKVNPNIEAIKGVFAHAETAIDTITKSGDPALSKFFCDAIKPAVESAMKELIASDFSYFNVAHKEIGTILTEKQRTGQADCKKAEFKATDFGKCLCADDTFFSYCVYYALGKEFEKKGFLADCATTPKFDSANKPKIVELLPKETEGGSSTDKPGGSGESAATTSSLLMAPLMAAAALLARR